MKMINLIALVFCTWFFSCQSPVDETQSKEVKKDTIHKADSLKNLKKIEIPKIDSLNDELVSLICAIPPRIKYKNIVASEFWGKYRKMVNSDWDVVSKHKIKPIKNWVDSMNLVIGKDTNTLFYPFAGADFLYANSFFPNAKNYILIGLEPVGFLKDPDSLKQQTLQNYLNKIESSLFFSNKVGFFRTNSMRSELNQTELDGTVHLLAFYIKRCGYNISGIKYFSLDTLGNTIDFVKKDKIKPYAVKISFCDSALTKTQNLYYFSYDLSNSYLKKHHEILTFVKNFGKQNTFLKAASYLMHTENFSVMKNFLVDNCDIVVQDDSGIPYRFFSADIWDIKLFGNYSKTIELFKHKYQPDLKKAIDASKFKGRIPFRIGYNVNHNEVNLLYSVKKKN